MSGGKKAKKAEYFEKVISLLEEYNNILLVGCDNIGSFHMQKIRRMLRGQAIILMGKNTMIRKAITMNVQRNPKWGKLLPQIVGNVGLVFSNGDLAAIRKILLETTVPAAAKAGIVAPQDVVVPKGVTTLEPTKTSFLQALNIASKINKGSVEILNDVHLIKEGDKVGSSEAALLKMLDICPFTYGLKVLSVYMNGSIYSPKVLAITDADVLKAFKSGVAEVAALSLGAHVPTAAALPHVLMDAYKNLLAVAVQTEYSFPQAEKVKKILENPGAFVQQAPVPGKTEPGKPAAPVEKEPEPEPESDDMGFDLFG